MRNQSPTMPILLCSIGVLLLAGCKKQASYVDPGGTETIVNVQKINIQDWSAAADDLVNSLLSSGRIKTPDGEPAIMAVSRVQNKTTQHVDTDLLTKKIRVALNKSGKVMTRITIGSDPEDPVGKENQELRDFLEDRQRPEILDYTLSGKLLEDRSRAGNLRQNAYIFQMSLADSRGIAVWEEEKTIVKQGERPSVGF